MNKQKNNLRRWQAGAVGLVVASALAAPAHAQFTGGGLSNQDSVPALGGGQEYTVASGDVTIQGDRSGDALGPLIRPVLPSSQEITTTFEFENWGNEIKGGITRVSGDRITALFGYTRGLPKNSELAVTVPLQRLSIDGFGSAYGVGDVMAAYRRYIFDPEDDAKPTIVYGLRAFLPSGSESRGLGLGQVAIGPSINVSKPFKNTLGYIGGGYTFVRGGFLGADYANLLNVYAGGLTQINQRWGVQYELSYFNSVTDEKYTRILVGPRYSLTPTRMVQLNFRQDLQAAGKPRSLSLGYSAHF